MNPQTTFWHIDLGQAAIICSLLVWIWKKGGTWQQKDDELASLAEWRETHDREAVERDRMINRLDNAVVKLSTLAENSEYRLRRLEAGDNRK